MKQFLITLAAVFVALCLFFIGVPIILLASALTAAKPAPAPGRTILSLDLREALTDQEPTNPLAFLQTRSVSVLGAVGALRRAEHDDRVKGLMIRLPEGGIAPAAADEIAGAVREFRQSGKPVIAFSQGIYPSGISTSAYMLGAASGRFWMQPGASLQSVGVAVEETFFKRAFDKYGVTADFEQRYEYKNAVNPFLHEDFTPAHREAELGWLTSVYEGEITAAAQDRRLTPVAVKSLLEAGPYSADEAAQNHLIDHVGEEHEAETRLIGEAGAGAKLTDLGVYAAAERRRRGSLADPGGAKLALIGAEGEIVTGTAHGSGFTSDSRVYSDDVAKAFYDAIADTAVKGIIFRVSSPGGSDTASEQILAAVRAAKAAGKPVVVSMGAYAASGGYWISSQASEIVAQPTTLTGSIGVFGGKFVVGPALARFGVDLHGLSIGGDYASAFGSEKPFSPEQRAKFSAWMDRIYEGFVNRVAEGRRLPVERVRQIARGRVWTGRQALALGLVDRLGGMDIAAGEAKRLAGLDPKSSIPLVEFPRRSNPLQALQRAFGAGGAEIRAIAALGVMLSDARAQALLSAVLKASGDPATETALAPQPLPR